ncbi:MAG TPA: alpha/beta fold hydrolase [Bryobacteraceae bacterium]|nr:alpha/beta fold hydrolase [Bryobacteraceae bacterium]
MPTENRPSVPQSSLSRRDFMAAGTAAGTLLASAADVTAQQAGSAPGSSDMPLDIAEWSYFWVGVDRAELARGVVVNGKQMYVEYQIPAQVKHPYPIVLVHGGGGQGLDWMGTPDGRPGWSTYLLQEGYKVYVVDRPGHGRPPFHPDLHGPFPQQNITLEQISGLFTPQRANAANAGPLAKLHNQWPGTGAVGSPELSQLVASQGGSFLQDIQASHTVWRERGAMLLDKIGPAIIMTHSAGGPFGYLVAEARPRLVKGIVVIEGAGNPFSQGNRWGVTTIPMTYDPPVGEPAELKTMKVDSPEPGVQPYMIQAEPARKLRHLQGIPIALVTAEASFASPGSPGALAFLKQAGCTAEELRLKDHGVHGNGHMMMIEKNNRAVLQPILDWIDKSVFTKDASAPAKKAQTGTNSTAIQLAKQGHFWVGTEQKKMPYGTILMGQMYVQEMIPAQVRHPYPVVLVHGGAGQGTHYMGLGDGQSGWAHFYLQEGYSVYLVDRPGHGRAPYHPDALGPITPVFTYDSVTGDFKRATKGPNRRWSGTGDVGDPLIDQFQAGQGSTPQNNDFAHMLWASRGAELLDRIGPAIISVHSAGGPFSWLVADQRPRLVKAIVNVEGAGSPFTPQTPWGLTGIPLQYDPPVRDPKELVTVEVKPPEGSPMQPYKLQAEPARKLKNLQGIPIAYVTAEQSGRTQSPAIVAFLKQAGCDAEDFQLKDHGIPGNGHFMMLETNRRQVFDAIRGWIEQKVKA